MARISSPVGQTINVVATTVSRSVIAGGGGGRGMTPTGGGGGGDSGVERGGAITVRPQASLVDRAQDLRITTTEQNFSGLQEELRVINVRVVELNQGLNNVAKLIQGETILEQNQLKQEQETERRLTENRIRIGKESELEKNITAALASPIVKLQNKVTSIFENIMGAMTTLFMGWLTNQGIETLKALAEGDTKKLNEIKNSIIKNIVLSIGTFVAVKTGFGLLMRTITGLTFSIAGLVSKIITAPFRAAAAGVRSIFSGGRSAPKPSGGTTSSGPKLSGAGRGFGGFIGKGLTALGGVMDLTSGQYSDAALAGLTLKGPGFIKPVAGIAYGADAIAEMFGGNIFGANPNQTVENSKPDNKPSTTPTITPQQSMMGTSPPPAPKLPAQSTSSTGTKTTEIKLQNPTTPQMSEFSFAADTENKLNAFSNMQPFVEAESTLKISPAKVQSPPKPQTPIGTLPEPQPNIIMSGGGQDRTQVAAPQQQEPLTDVPFIPSANPDNFYVLYSQLNYNVVM